MTTSFSLVSVLDAPVRPFAVLLCVERSRWVIDRYEKYSWVDPDCINKDDVVTAVGVVAACTQRMSGVTATITMAGYARVANYWDVSALVAGTVVGFRWRDGCLQPACSGQVCRRRRRRRRCLNPPPPPAFLECVGRFHPGRTLL